MKHIRPALTPALAGLICAALYLFFTKTQSPQPLTSFSEAVNKAIPAVVNIYSRRDSGSERPGVWEDPLFAPYSEQLIIPKEQPSRLGSGVIFDDRGHIITNYHVIKQTDDINVLLNDGREGKAKIIGLDKESDLAVLKIELDRLKAIEISTTAHRVGDIVLAIGNPFGVGQTVTQGIISGLGRSNLGLATFENFIQTDVALNPGNSGGALINTKGQLIGLNTAVFSQTGGFQGISFAVPAQSALNAAKAIIEKGEVIRGYLGIAMHELSVQEADFFGLADTNGLLVTRVHAGSPAELSGIESGDVLLAINGEAMVSAQGALTYISRNKPGSRINLDLFRKGKYLSVEAVLTKRKSPKS